MKIALVHDYLVQYGGAERVLECFAELFPHAPIYTLVYNKDSMHGKFDQKDIRTSFIQKIPFFIKRGIKNRIINKYVINNYSRK